jgi:transcription elongation factor GreA
MKKVYHITIEGKAELEAELEELKGRRSEVAEKIANARDYGDLSENAEYDSAREEQGLVESRVAEIEDILQNAEIIKATKSSTIKVGSTVVLKNGSVVTYRIVGPVEAEPFLSTTVEPTLIVLDLVALMISAFCKMSSISATRLSTSPCSSRALSYSAFSDKSP